MPNNILIIAEEREGHLRKVSFELVTVAKEMAKGLGGAIEAAVIGANTASAAEAIAKSSVSHVYLADDPALQSFAPELYAAVLADLIRRRSARRRGARGGRRPGRARRRRGAWGSPSSAGV